MIRSNSRQSKRNYGIFRTPIWAFCLLLTLIYTPAFADGTNYSSDRRQIKACVLVSNAASSAATCNGSNIFIKENAVPHVFYIMDKRTDLKPGGWEFVNPLAPSTLSADVVQRWKCRDTGMTDTTLGNSSFNVGAPLTKNMGAYWEVDLDAVSSDDLQKFDIVLLAYHNNGINFNVDEREKLRRFADGGGTVWFEDEGNSNITGGPFIVDTIFIGNFPANAPVTYSGSLNAQLHPLVNSPFTLSNNDILRLGVAGTGTNHAAAEPVTGNLVNTRIIVPVILKGGMPLVSAGDFGAGHIVLSSASVATGVSGFAGGPNVGGEGGNTGAVSGDLFLAALPTDIKFAYNLIGWISSIPTAGVNARRTNGTSENIGSDLGRKWQTLVNSSAGLGSGAILHKGVVFWVDGANILHAYDASPDQDLDNNRNTDDGIVDHILGAPYDEIWNADLTTFGVTSGARVSTPTIVNINTSLTVPTPQDYVVVTSSNGVTLAFKALPIVAATGLLSPTAQLAWSISSPDTMNDLGGTLLDNHDVPLPAPTPAFSEGILFTIIDDPSGSALNPWRVAAIDPKTGLDVFGGNSLTVSPTNAFPIPALPNVVGPLVVGYVRDESTGALDKMVYVPTRQLNTPTGPVGGGLVAGQWFSTKNEPMQAIDVNNPGPGQHKLFRARGIRGQVPWFLPNPGNPQPAGLSLAPVIHLTSNPAATLIYNVDFTVNYVGPNGAREIVITLANPVMEDAVYADYTLDWPDAPINAIPNVQSPMPTAVEMARLSSRRFGVYSPANTNQLLAGSPPLTTSDLMILHSGDFPGQDRVYALKDQYHATAPGITAASARMAWSWAPNGPSDEDNIGPNGLLARLPNNDPIVTNLTNTGNPLIASDLELIGSAAYANGVVYVVGYCHMKYVNEPGIKFNATIVMALRADPDTTFTVKQADGTLVKIPSDGTLVTLQQIDLVNSTPGNPRYITLFENQNFTVDRDTSTIHITDFKSSNRGDVFNTALPIHVRIGATLLQQPIYDPKTGYGPLDNLLWWTAIPIGPTFPNPPAPGSKLARLFSNVNPASGPTIVGDALYFGTINGNIASVDLTGIPNSGGQVNLLKSDGTLRVSTQAVLIDPANGVQAINQMIIHPPSVTTGIAVVGTGRGLTALDNQLTLIADNNRILEVDHAGRAVLSVDTVQSVSVAGGVTLQAIDGGTVASTRIPLARPNVAHRYTLNQYIIADTGNNRILQMDRGGLATWELHTLNNGMKFLRPGDPVSLNLPTDVQTYTDSNINGSIVIINPATNISYSYNGQFFATHFIVADSGNFRGLEIVDAVDFNNNPIVLTSSSADKATFPDVLMQRQVVFVTRSLAEQNLHFRYRTMQQFVAQDPNNPNILNTFMVAAVENVRQGAVDPNTIAVGDGTAGAIGPGGSIALIRRYPNPPAQDGDLAAVISSIAITDSNGNILRRQAINNPTYFKEYNDKVLDAGGNLVTQLLYLMADSNGVYLLKPNGTGEALVDWMLSSDDYFLMTGRKLRATSIQKLNQSDPYPIVGPVKGFKPHFLITNGFSSLDNVGKVFNNKYVLPGEMRGEVFEIRSLDYYLSIDNTTMQYNGYRQNPAWLYKVNNLGVLVQNPTSSITWMTPNEKLPGVDNMNNPIFRQIQRSIGLPTGGTATYLLEQPSFSDRPF